MKLEIPSLDGEGNTTEIEAEDKLFLGKNLFLIYLLLTLSFFCSTMDMRREERERVGERDEKCYQ